ncbi:MAG: DUF4252 domain-containing protein [Chitinophagales bacterium]
MKKVSILAITCCLLFLNIAHAASPGKEGTKLNIWIPGILVKLATDIAEDYMDNDAADAMLAMAGTIGDINVCVREGDYYNFSDKKLVRKLNKLQERNYASLVTVIEEQTQVQLSIKQKKNGNLKRLVVLVDEKEESFVYIKMHCNIDIQKVGTLLRQYDLMEL